MPDDAGNFMRPATHFGGTGGVDPDIHDRTSPNGSETLTSGNYTSSASAEISGITDVNIKKFKRWARVQASGIPGGSGNTTIIGSIVHNGVDDNSIFLIDSETGSAASVTATGDLTIDMGGNSGVSTQAARMESHRHDLKIDQLQGAITSGDGLGQLKGLTSDLGRDSSPANPVVLTAAIDSSGAGLETRPSSLQRFKYTLP